MASLGSLCPDSLRRASVDPEPPCWANNCNCANCTAYREDIDGFSVSKAGLSNMAGLDFKRFPTRSASELAAGG